MGFKDTIAGIAPGTSYLYETVRAAASKAFNPPVTSTPGEIITEEARSPAAAANFGIHGSSIRFSSSGLSGGAKYPHGLSGDGRGNFIDHYRVRQNARVAYQETLEAKAMVDRFADTVVDVGLRVEPGPVASMLGMSQEQAEEWGDNVAQRFDLYMRSKKSHRRQTMTGYQMQRLYQIAQQRDNDIFVRLYYSNEKTTPSPLQLDFIDPDQIRGSAFTSTFGFDTADFPDGIQRDAKGREKAYQVWSRDRKTGGFKAVTIPRVGEKSKRLFMLHGFNPEYSTQGRGYSRLTHALQELQNITDLSLSVIKKAINQSLISMKVESKNENPVINPFESLTQRKAGPSSGVGATTTPGIDAEASLKLNYTELPEVEARQPGSVGVFNLEGEQELSAFKAEMGSDEYDKIMDTFISSLSASSSIPIEVLKMRFGTNYSASRGALVLFWRVVQIWREEMAADFLNPVYESWLSEEIGAGRISAPGWQNPVLRQAWVNARWIGQPMPNIDPLRTMTADVGYIEIGATTQDQVARNLNGSSSKANRAKNKKAFPDTPVPPWMVSRTESKTESTSEIIE